MSKTILITGATRLRDTAETLFALPHGTPRCRVRRARTESAEACGSSAS